MKLMVMYKIFNELGDEVHDGRATVRDARPIKSREYIRKIEKKLELELKKGRVKIYNWKVIGTLEEHLKNR